MSIENVLVVATVSAIGGLTIILGSVARSAMRCAQLRNRLRQDYGSTLILIDESGAIHLRAQFDSSVSSSRPAQTAFSGAKMRSLSRSDAVVIDLVEWRRARDEGVPHHAASLTAGRTPDRR